MNVWIQNIISAGVGIVLGVIIEDPLTSLRDNLLLRYKRLFYKKPTIPSEEFHFGNIQTTWKVLDGTGEEEYTPETVVTHFENKRIEVSPLVKREKEHISQEQDKLHKNGQPFAWNGDALSLHKFLISREGREEKQSLELWFQETDYFTFMASNDLLEHEVTRVQLLPEHTSWGKPVPQVCNMLGINLTVITEDEYLILTKRSTTVSSYKDLYHISVNEGLSRAMDRGAATHAPDVYRCAVRGLAEELGVIDVTTENIALLSFGVDTKHGQWGLLGSAKVNKSAEEILEWRNRGAKDKWEATEIHLVKFDLNEIVSFVADHPNWTPSGLTCLYHTLVHHFKRGKVDEAIKKYLS